MNGNSVVNSRAERKDWKFLNVCLRRLRDALGFGKDRASGFCFGIPG
jgi:hypothetical protein